MAVDKNSYLCAFRTKIAGIDVKLSAGCWKKFSVHIDCILHSYQKTQQTCVFVRHADCFNFLTSDRDDCIKALAPKRKIKVVTDHHFATVISCNLHQRATVITPQIIHLAVDTKVLPSPTSFGEEKPKVLLNKGFSSCIQKGKNIHSNAQCCHGSIIYADLHKRKNIAAINL